ncbi:MAG: flagellar biosynthesis regulator FlaF [Pseudomonadota bacterium]
MSAYALKNNGYLDATRHTGTPREIEYQLFSRITGRLNQARAQDVAYADLVAALQDNLTLWRTITIDVMDDANSLPPQLRAQLVYLYEFTAAHTRKVLRKDADVTALIEVNASVMRGLRAGDPGKAG